MKPAAWRLVVTAVLFLSWVGYLAYLALMTRNPVVLSRPQFLVSELHVLATRDGGDDFVVNDVLWPPDKKVEWQGKKIVVDNLKDCETWSAKGWQTAPPPEGQKVLMPLRQAGSDFDVSPIPASPGYPPPDARGPAPAPHASTPPIRQCLASTKAFRSRNCHRVRQNTSADADNASANTIGMRSAACTPVRRARAPTSGAINSPPSEPTANTMP